MTDLATLGIRIQSDEVATADHRLDEFQEAAVRAEAAADKVGASARGMGNAFQTAARGAAQHRAGVQQLGLQINDFGTQVSTGINPLVAFNQQLGQVGFAMAQMQGRAGAIGAFLAGPWGAAITLAVAGLGMLAGKLFDNDSAARSAADGLEQFRKRQSEIVNFIDKTTGALKEQNQTLVQNAILTRQAKIDANRDAVDEARRRAFGATVGVSGTFGTITPGSSGGLQGPSSTAAREVQAVVAAAGGDVEKLDAGLRELVARRPDLQSTVRTVSDAAAQAVLLTRESRALREEVVALQGGTNRLTQANASLIESQVGAATATTAVERAQASLDQVRTRGRAELEAGTITAEQYRQRLTAATVAVNAAQAAERSLREARRVGNAEVRESVRDYERLLDSGTDYLQSLITQRETLGMNAGELLRYNAAARARELVDKGATKEALDLASAILDQAVALDVARTARERSDAAKKGGEALTGMLTQLERQAELAGASAETQAYLNAQWAIADLKLKEITPDMQVLINRIKEMAQSNAVAQEAQERFNQYLRDTVDLARQADDALQSAARGFADAFGDKGDALGGMLSSLSAMQARLAEIDAQRQSGKLTAEQELLLERERATVTVNAYGDMIQSARGYFKEGSDGYKALLAVEQVYRAFQLAGALQSMALGGQETAMSVANSLAKGAASAAAGAAKMFETLGPFGFPAVAAMLGLLAGLGLGSRGGGGARAAANDNTADASTAAVRGYTARDQQGQSATVSALAQAVTVRVTTDDDRFNAYVDGRTQPVTAAAHQSAISTARSTVPVDQSRRAARTLKTGRRA